ncbi:MAG: UDP-N-acetylglucosamine--N-acetylmuramyl-(pentapeptide) pyrophosphoryl-undecaprenol N-acetylglucosamine transferase [Candidatus Omnitrophica bacterium]|nr:UDP-N-acetylglucosamine--N-acetylmuramyl-(pentapeptide) pyrophosphoryl-undecaprenol N-acetylglucosamine transferase [Candidatus Omnitrophota bacterium]
MKPKGISKIMVLAGESGGHVFPAVGFCQGLKHKAALSAEITFVTTRTQRSGAWIPEEFNPVFLKINRTIAGLFKLVIHAFYLMWRIQPDVVFGFGGYVTVPFIILGRLCGKRTLIHEQNVVPGRANRILSIFVDRVAVSFEKSLQYFKKGDKVFLVSYPLRETLKRVERQEALRFLGLDSHLFTLLIIGGSQGARRINESMLEALKGNERPDLIQVIHLCGEQDLDKTSRAYAELSIKHRVHAFLNEMHYAYSAADLVISRSGAGAIFEIMYFGLPSILVPYPYAGAHQVENAKFLAEKGAALLLEESSMSAQMINGLLNIFIDDTMRRKTMSALTVSLYESCQNRKLEELLLS